MENYYIGIDIGGTNIRIGYGRSGEEVLGYEKLPRESILKEMNFSFCLGEFVRQYMDRYGLGKETGSVSGIGIGLPSILSIDRKTVLQTPNIPGMNGIPLAEELEEMLQISVYLEKDTNILFLHDSYGMEYNGLGVGIYVGTGIGNALFFAGVPYVGFNGVAGELGHIPARGSKRVCGCGNVGCAETIASGTYLSHLQKEVYPRTEIGELFSKHGEDQVLQQFVEDVAMVIAAQVNILDPEFVIVGGGVPDMKDFPKEKLVDWVHFYSRKPYPDQNLKIIFAPETQQSGVLGAIALACSKNG